MSPETEFAEELQAVLPDDLPHRDRCVEGAARHLALMSEVNEQFNLTRIVSPHEAAIKHVLDSVLPWRFFEGAGHVVDAGSGAGFPGISLALILPDTGFTLVESKQKKAGFLTATATALGLSNVAVVPDRVETWVKDHSPDIITARALTPLSNAVRLFSNPLNRGVRVLLYKGPEVHAQITEAMKAPQNRNYSFRIVHEFALPAGMGSRCIVEVGQRQDPKKKREREHS